MSASYPIKRWDAVMFGPNLQKIPMIYIEPNEPFLEFIRNNNFSVLCEISETGMNYDTTDDAKLTKGIVNQSGLTPNCRPNFFAATGLFVVQLLTPWIGYPKETSKGSVKFFGLSQTAIQTQNPNLERSYAQKPIEVKDSSGKTKKIALILTTTILLLIAIGIIIFLSKK